jgi:hypothetical protein
MVKESPKKSALVYAEKAVPIGTAQAVEKLSTAFIFII